MDSNYKQNGFLSVALLNLYRGTAGLLVLILPFLAIVNTKIRLGLKLRLRQMPEARSTRPLWIHASSGEFESAKSLIREIKKQDPQVTVLVTYFSPSYRYAIESFPGVDLAMPLPLDLPGPCRSFLKKYQPQCLWIARTDLWPEMLIQCRRLNIPTAIFACTQKPITQQSVFAKLWKRWLYSLVDQIFAVSDADESVLRELTTTPVSAQGDPRYDQVAYRLAHPKDLKKALFVGDAKTPPILVAGSTWPPDEVVLLDALGPLVRNRRMRLIIVPHEPTAQHVADLKNQLAAKDIKSFVYTTHELWPEDCGALIVDEVGRLADLYAYADLAFVGGSFRKSVHSVMEPLGALLPTFIGPKYTNSREAMSFVGLKPPGVIVVNNASEWSERLQLTLSDSANLKSASESIRKELAQHLGATNRLLRLLPR